MDNCVIHKSDALREAIEGQGAFQHLIILRYEGSHISFTLQVVDFISCHRTRPT